MVTRSTATRVKAARAAIALVTMLALTSQGLAIVGAPLLLPALWLTSLRAHTWVRAGLVVLAALVMLEVGWFIIYSTFGEKQPYIVVGPAVGVAATVATFALSSRRGR